MLKSYFYILLFNILLLFIEINTLALDNIF